MGSPHETLMAEGEKALTEVAARLMAIAADDIVPPSCDPHAAAVTALLVADYLRQPDARSRLARGLDHERIDEEGVRELGSLARALLAVITKLGGDYLPNTRALPAEMIAQGEAVRKTLVTALEKALPDDADVKQWLDAVRVGEGTIDLVYDLRILGYLAARRLPDAASNTATTSAVKAARTAAHALEIALRDGESADDTKRRDAVARLWTLFEPAYEKGAKAGRALTREEGKEQQFPPLALVASHRRARKRPFSLVPPAPLSQERKSDPGPEAGDRQSASEGRKATRHKVEIEVGIASESNLYVGFTENLSATGVFVATYTRKPIGAKVEVVMSFPNGDDIRANGVVRWLREATSAGWPGMGVQFEELSPEDDAKLKKFLSLRDPLFYDD